MPKHPAFRFQLEKALCRFFSSCPHGVLWAFLHACCHSLLLPLHEGYARQGSNMSVLRTRPGQSGPTESLLSPLAAITQGLFKMKQRRQSHKSFLCHAFPIASVHSYVEAVFFFITLLSIKCSLRTCWSNILIWISTNTFLFEVDRISSWLTCQHRYKIHCFQRSVTFSLSYQFLVPRQ